MALTDWSAEQWAIFMENARREWVSTAPLDREKVEKAIHSTGINLPVVWAESPVELGVIASSFSQFLDAERLNAATRTATITGLVNQWIGEVPLDDDTKEAYRKYMPALAPMLSEPVFNRVSTSGHNLNTAQNLLNNALTSGTGLGWNFRRDLERQGRWRPPAALNAINNGVTEFLGGRPRFEIDTKKSTEYRNTFANRYINEAISSRWAALLTKYSLPANEALYNTFSKWLTEAIRKEMEKSISTTPKAIDAWAVQNQMRPAFAVWSENVEFIEAVIKDGTKQDFLPKEAATFYEAYKELRGVQYLLQTPVAVIVSERPVELHRDDRRRIHKQDGPAVKWKDGFELYAINGVVLPKTTVEGRDKLTPTQIFRTRNVEQRRVLMDLYGLDKIFEVVDKPGVNAAREIGVQVTEVSKDDNGRLLSIQQWDDEPIVVVAVKNSSPEPDGSVKDYFLRVPPRMRTPTQALAWTFGTRVDRYTPEIET